MIFFFDSLGFAWAWLALGGRKAIPRFLARFRDFERPEHAQRTPAGTHTCAVVYTHRPPACPTAESARKDPQPEEKSFVFRRKVSFIHDTSMRFPFGMWLTGNPGGVAI